MTGKAIQDISVGDHASFEKTLSESDVYLYAGITGDLNPMHINTVLANESFFKGRIVHGMLVSSLISTVLGMSLPGPGTIYLGQNLKFLAPVRIGDTINATCRVTEVNLAKNQVTFETICTHVETQKRVIEGTALVMPPLAKKGA